LRKRKRENTKRKPGRPTKYTDATVNQILESIHNGNYAVVAARKAGICEDTFYEWIKTKPEFSEAVKKEESVAEEFHVARIIAGEKNWTSSAWWLERKFPKRWGRDRGFQEDHKEDPEDIFLSHATPDGGAVIAPIGTDPIEIYEKNLSTMESKEAN